MKFLLSPRLRLMLMLTLALLIMNYFVWFTGNAHFVTNLVVFILPAAMLCLGVFFKRRTAPFWSGVFALGWFSHGVMFAWSEPDYVVFAGLEILLAVTVIIIANWPGLSARFKHKGA